MQIICVNKNSCINTLEKALNMINDDKVIIKIAPGIYEEKIKLTKSNVTILGENPHNTIITFNDYALKIHPDGKEYNTFRTYTMMVVANNVTLENITVENSIGSGKTYGQAVALAVIGDMLVIKNCIIKGHQDTLFLGPLPRDLIIRYQNFLPQDELIFPKNHRYLIESSTIIGDVDFIFGAGNAYFLNCEIISNPVSGFIAAPATEEDDFYGFTFVNCELSSMSKKADTYLARPWRDYGKAVFINCLMDEHVHEAGWDKWGETTRDKTCRFYKKNEK